MLAVTPEIGLGYADDGRVHGAGQATVGDLDDGAEGSLLAVELRLPSTPAHKPWAARRVVGDIQHAPQRGPHAERMEEFPVTIQAPIGSRPADDSVLSGARPTISENTVLRSRYCA